MSPFFLLLACGRLADTKLDPYVLTPRTVCVHRAIGDGQIGARAHVSNCPVCVVQLRRINLYFSFIDGQQLCDCCRRTHTRGVKCGGMTGCYLSFVFFFLVGLSAHNSEQSRIVDFRLHAINTQ